jgi:hypothetical protein
MSALPSRKNFRAILCCLAGLLCLVGGLAPVVGAQSLPLYTVSAGDNGINQLRTIDPLTGNVLTNTTITLTNEKTVTAGNGLAQNPQTGQLFAILTVSGVIGRVLATVNPATGVATELGSTGDSFAGITFATNGTLYGVTGSGATTPSTLYTLSTTTGVPTFVKALGSQACGGESIAFNPVDGLIYHAAGSGNCQLLETINTTTLAATNIPLTGDAHAEVLAMVHWSGNFFLFSTSNDLYVITKNGQARLLSSLSGSTSYKGLVFAGTAPACPPLAALYGAANIGPDGPSVLYSIDPATAVPTLIGPIGFERVSGIAFNASQTLFGTGERQDGSNTSVLMTINPCTGVGTEVGPTLINSDGFATITDISVRKSDGTVFAFLAGSPLPSSNGLAILNTSTGAHTLLKSYEQLSGGALAFSPGSVLFNVYGSNLETLNTTTGAMTLVAPLSFPASISANSPINALDFQPGTGILFASSPTGSGVNSLLKIDTAAGTVTVVGSGTTQTGLDAIAFFFPPAAPAASITATGGTPQSTIFSHAFAAPLQATVKDSNGNPVAGVTVTFTPPASGASGTFAGGVNTAITNPSGVATSVTFTANSTVGGPYNVVATVAGVATPANFALTNTVGAPAQIAATGGTPQSAVISTAFALPLQATVKDSGGNLVPGVTVTFTAPTTGASGTFAGGVNTAVTNSSGVATSGVFTANGITGAYSVTVSLPSAGSPEFIAATAHPEGFATQAAYSLKNVDYSVAATTTTQTVKAGATANYSLNFTTIVGNSVNATIFSCQGLPALSACVFTPSSVPANSGNTPFTLAITTTAAGTGLTGMGPANKLMRPMFRVARPGMLALFSMLALMLSIFVIPKRNFARLRMSAVSVFGFAALLLLTSYVSGCGGAGTGFPLGGGTPGTPAGTYTVTVVGTSGSAQRTTTVTLIVQ